MDSESEKFSVKYTLAWYEYIVFGLVLTASLGIGIFHGFFGRKNKTNDEFLLGGRSMSILPVTLSLLVSCVSAVTLLGYPAEIYLYGAPLLIVGLCLIPMTFALAYIYVPVYFELRLTSAYEYFEWRFSPFVRNFASFLALMQMIVHVPSTVWGPSLAFQQVADVDPVWTAGVMFLVCIVYSSIGGLRGILWTDVLQGAVMFGAIFAVVILGTYELGGIGAIWEVADKGFRTNVFRLDPDPRTKHTLWTTLIGTTVLWLLLFGATQFQIQRYNSVPTLRDARKCLFYNLCGYLVLLTFTSFIGIMIFAYYATCDPILAKKVSSADQLVPFFVMDLLSKHSGLSGLLVAGITCGSLSSVSSLINSIAAIITEDYVKRFRPFWNEVELGFASKVVSVLAGLLCFSLIYVVAVASRVVLIMPFTGVTIAAFYGPILGAFTLGMIFPWVSTAGALCGMISSMIVTSVIGVGGILAGMNGQIYDQRLPRDTSGCNGINETTNKASDWSWNSWKETPEAMNADILQDIWNIPYLWHSTIATFMTIFVGLAVSLIFRSGNKVNHKLLSKPFVRLWVFVLGKNFVNKWVDFDETKTKEIQMHRI